MTALVGGAAVLLVVAPSLPISLLALALLAAGLSARPVLGLPILGFTLPFYLLPKSLGSVAVSMPEVILLCTLAGATANAVMRPVRAATVFPRGGGVANRLATPLDGPIALFLAAALLSLLASEVLRVSLRDLRTVVLEPAIAFYLTVWLTRSRDDLLTLIAGLVLGGAAAAAMGIYQYAVGDHIIVAEGTRRILGPYLSPNNLGLYLGRILPMGLAAALYMPRPRAPAVVLTAMLAVALLLTFSLGAWLASLLATATVLLLWRPRTAGTLVAAVFVLLGASVPLLSIERISSHLSISRGTSFIRLQVWDSALQMIRDHPLLGVGMDNFLYHYRGEYLRPEAVAEPNLSHPHNLLLNFWLQMGIPGVAAAVWLAAALARIWHRLWRNALDPRDRALLVGLAGAAVDLVAHGMVDNSYFLVDLAFQFWLSAAVMVVMAARLDRECTIPPNRVH